MTQSRILIVASLLALSFVACQSSESEPQAPPEEPVVTREAAPEPTAEEVTFEPAYPEEVSPEGLTEEDVDQQHGHSHGPDGDHTHDDPQDDGHGHP